MYLLLTKAPEIYGDPQVVPQPETYFGNVNSFGPRSCYDEGKRVSEALAHSYRTQHGVSVRVARIFNAYGPSMAADDGRAVPNFVAAAIGGAPIRIYGDGRATRCFHYAADCVEGLAALMESGYEGPVNIGSDREVTVGEVARLVAQVVASKTGRDEMTPIIYLPKREDDPVRRRPDITVAQQQLGWRPKVSLEQGIALMVDSFLEKGAGRDMGHVQPAL